MFRIDRPIARISSSLVLYCVPCSDSFTLAYVRAVLNLHTGRSLAPLAMGDPGTSTILIWYVLSIPLRFLHQSERITVRDTVQHKRWTYPCYRAVNKEHQQRWTCWWCISPSKHLENCDKQGGGGGTKLKVHKCCTPVNETMSEILNCCHYFLSNPCRMKKFL